jgi:S1-C subfamily serine protease
MSIYDRPRAQPQFPLAAVLVLLLFLVLLLIVPVLVVWHFFWARGHGDESVYGQPRAVTPAGNLAEDEKATIALYRKVSPSVAHIDTLALQRTSPFSFNVQQVPEGTGSGFVWDKGGHIVTNFHVIKQQGKDQPAPRIQVTLVNGSSGTLTRVATVKGYAQDRDLAVLQINNVPDDLLVPVEVGTSADLQVGQKAFAIGNPFGLDHTLTTGIVSALNRSIDSTNNRTIKGVIQTDAAINPGNSGGPLLDSSARLIGVTTAIYSTSGGFVGIGFAIPVDEVNRVVPELIANQKVVRPSLGVTAATEKQAKQVKVTNGVLVLSVLPESPAAQAGIQGTRYDEDGNLILGDVITAIDDKPVQKVKDLFDILGDHKVHDKVKLTIIRNGQEKTVEVTLGEATS